jgi:hypothetical protein
LTHSKKNVPVTQKIISLIKHKKILKEHTQESSSFIEFEQIKTSNQINELLEHKLANAFSDFVEHKNFDAEIRGIIIRNGIKLDTRTSLGLDEILTNLEIEVEKKIECIKGFFYSFHFSLTRQVALLLYLKKATLNIAISLLAIFIGSLANAPPFLVFVMAAYFLFVVIHNGLRIIETRKNFYKRKIKGLERLILIRKLIKEIPTREKLYGSKDYDRSFQYANIQLEFINEIYPKIIENIKKPFLDARFLLQERIDEHNVYLAKLISGKYLLEDLSKKNIKNQLETILVDAKNAQKRINEMLDIFNSHLENVKNAAINIANKLDLQRETKEFIGGLRESESKTQVIIQEVDVLTEVLGPYLTEASFDQAAKALEIAHFEIDKENIMIDII